MLEHSDTDEAPWHVVGADVKRHARLNCIHHLLQKIPFQEIPTEPVELPEQPEFLNLVCRVQTELKPEALLRACQEIESEMGRIRKEIKGARNIDIDILFYGQQILQRPSLRIPHPAWCKRNFVLIPLAEIAPDFRDPVTAKTVSQLRWESPDGARVTPQKKVLSPQE